MVEEDALSLAPRTINPPRGSDHGSHAFLVLEDLASSKSKINNIHSSGRSVALIGFFELISNFRLNF